MKKEEKKKLSVVYGPLLHYRIPLFNEIAERYNLTVFTTEYNGSLDGLLFKIVVLKPCVIGPFVYQTSLRRYHKKERFDFCIVFLDVAYISSLIGVVFRLAPKVYVWGIWFTASRTSNAIRMLAIKMANAALFYCDKHLREAIRKGADKNKLYVAHNSVYVPQISANNQLQGRNSILFVGTFAPRKGLERLVYIFEKCLPKLPNGVKLILVGDGPLFPEIKELVHKYNLVGSVELPGKINEVERLALLYSRAIVAVSLSQAGLSVLQSMGFGVPFMTVKGSISGGENLNIIHGYSGLLIDDNDGDIEDALVYCVNNPDVASKMGTNALMHYKTYASIQNYAQGFFDAIEGTRRANVWNAV